jgi:hypothetical protein
MKVNLEAFPGKQLPSGKGSGVQAEGHETSRKALVKPFKTSSVSIRCFAPKSLPSSVYLPEQCGIPGRQKNP